MEKFNHERLNALIEQEIRNQEISKGSTVSQGILWGWMTKTIIAAGLGLLVVAYLFRWCGDRSEDSRSKFLLLKSKARLKSRNIGRRLGN